MTSSSKSRYSLKILEIYTDITKNHVRYAISTNYTRRNKYFQLRWLYSDSDIGTIPTPYSTIPDKLYLSTDIIEKYSTESVKNIMLYNAFNNIVKDKLYHKQTHKLIDSNDNGIIMILIAAELSILANL